MSSDSDEEDHKSGFLALPPRLGDFGRLRLDAYRSLYRPQLHLAFLFSKDGIPSFECSSKPAFLAEKDIVDDFLWMDNVPGFPSYPREAQNWWSDLGDRVLVDRYQWYLVQQAMAKFSCLVEVKAKPGANWTEVAPIRHVPSDVKTSDSSRSTSGSGTAKKGRRGQSGRRTSSGLRHEVSQD